mgnify:CR=1 FL=1
MQVETVNPVATEGLSTERKRVLQRSVPLHAHGTPFLWLMGGLLGVALAMVVGVIVLVLIIGSLTFWPLKIVQYETLDGKTHLGEVTRVETYKPSREQVSELPDEFRKKASQYLEARQGVSERYLVRTGNYELTNTHFNWVSDFQIGKTTYPDWAFVWERVSWGRFYGIPAGFQLDTKTIAEGPEESYRLFRKHFLEVKKRRDKIHHLEKEVLGSLNYRLEQARLAVRDKELKLRKATSESRESLERSLQKEQAAYHALKEKIEVEYNKVRSQIEELKKENQRYSVLMKVSDGNVVSLPLSAIVRGYPANQLGWFQRLSIYIDRWVEFLTAEPREANSEGGVFPAIFGTVVMTLLMSLVVSPLGVIAALYLREYAKAGFLVSAVRIALNNLAGVPSIVFGVFGLGFFCYFLGTTIDQLFFAAKLPNPTFGTGGILWSSLTLALLTLPVVIVASEEALAAVPNSMREGAYACGASKWQTIQRIVIPRALPGILTGMILAMARGAGEVAPLMLVGAVKLAPELPIDGNFPFIHLERSFMHLGFHIYDVGFQSQNSEAAKPMVFTTTLLLILIIFVLNLAAIYLRNRLYRKVIARDV